MYKNIKELDFLDLEHKDNLNKFYSWIPGLRLSDKIKDRNIKLEDGFFICSQEQHKTYRKIIGDYVKENFNVVNISSVVLYFKYPKDNRYYFVAQDKVRRFLTSVKIFYNQNVDSILELSVCDNKDEKYFRIDNLSEHSDRQRELITDVYWRRNFIEIENEEYLKKIKKIYNNLGIADVENFNKYSPLHNSIKFYEHSYRERWALLKTMLLFVSLESILGEKTEITYKISSRASYLLYPKNSKKRLEIFNFLKKVYGIRSSFAHGGNVETDIRKIEKQMKENKGVDYYGFHDDFVKDLESIVIGCLKIILLDKKLTELFSSTTNSKKISKFLDELVIG
ncbi:hypothetical protein GW764_01590 [Candidatus Parcubacteria bacterium]|nr:hypothetical protein [Candidatus Parcubacteria bacterium]